MSFKSASGLLDDDGGNRYVYWSVTELVNSLRTFFRMKYACCWRIMPECSGRNKKVGFSHVCLVVILVRCNMMLRDQFS